MAAWSRSSAAIASSLAASIAHCCWISTSMPIRRVISSSNTGWTQLNPQNNDGTGNPIASLLLGLPNSGDQPNEPSVVSTSGYMAFYIQDDWKLTPKLTVNAGLRWDAEIPRVEKNNQLSYWNADATSPLQGLVPSSAACPNCGNLKGQMVLVGTTGLAVRSPSGTHQLE